MFRAPEGARNAKPSDYQLYVIFGSIKVRQCCSFATHAREQGTGHAWCPHCDDGELGGKSTLVTC